jgi:hypothetical protein
LNFSGAFGLVTTAAAQLNQLWSKSGWSQSNLFLLECSSSVLEIHPKYVFTEDSNEQQKRSIASFRISL